jgi:histidinol dehydrogenase
MKTYSYPSKAAERKLNQIVDRGMNFKKKDIAAVNRILEDVRRGGDQALIGYVNRFDSPRLTVGQLKVDAAEMKKAKNRVARSLLRSLKRAAKQIESFHRRQLPRSWFAAERAGTFLGQMVHPVDRAGIYVPGGTAGNTPLVSSVLMGAIPAKIAGVEKIVMVTPAGKNGKISPHLLAAAELAGVDEVYKVGSAWAVAALTFGTETVPRTDVVVGPGNIYVTLAKKLVAGTVGIDMIAGPSEILVLADDSADPDHIAADLLSQAEHDVLASAMLITDSKHLADGVSRSLQQQLAGLSRKEIAAASLDRYGAIMVVAGIDTAIDLANRIAPEHLELQLQDPFARLGQIRNAGAVFIGAYTPEPVGDYIAGPNHVLPTAGTARFASALSVEHFLKKTSLVFYSKDAFEKEAADIVRLAETEGLTAHANAVKIRTKARTRRSTRKGKLN